MLRVGVISDTHGLLRPEALAFLDGSAHIIHAGDIGDPSILEQLSKLAPVTAVRGNNDTAEWAVAVPETQLLEIEGILLYVIHELARLDRDPVAAGIKTVISGHSHRPSAGWQGGVLYLNPGSAGPRRFKLPISVAELRIEGDAVTPFITELQVASTNPRRRRG